MAGRRPAFFASWVSLDDEGPVVVWGGGVTTDCMRQRPSEEAGSRSLGPGLFLITPSRSINRHPITKEKRNKTESVNSQLQKQTQESSASSAQLGAYCGWWSVKAV